MFLYDSSSIGTRFGPSEFYLIVKVKTDDRIPKDGFRVYSSQKVTMYDITSLNFSYLPKDSKCSLQDLFSRWLVPCATRIWNLQYRMEQIIPTAGNFLCHQNLEPCSELLISKSYYAYHRFFSIGTCSMQ